MINLRKPLLAALAFVWLASSVLAQTPPVPLGPSGSPATGTGGSGTMTSAAIVAGTNVTLSGTCSSTTAINCTVNASGGGTPGGSVGQVQFNSAGSFGGFTVSGDCTLVTSTGVITCTAINGKAVTLGGPLTTTGAGTTTLAFGAAGFTYTFPAASATLGTASGPVSSTSGDIASFNGTGGQTLQDSGVLATNVATGPASAVSGNLASFNGTGGKTLQDSGIAPPTPPPAPNATTQTQLYALIPTVVAISATAPSQNTARCSPFFVAVAQHWDELAMGITTLGTGPITVALYADAIDSTTHIHQPQTLITSSSGSFTVTGTGLVTSAMGVAGTGIPIPAGLNWVCTNDVTATDAVRYDGIGPTSTYYMNLVGSIGTGNVTSLLGTSQFQSMIKTSVTSGTWNSFVGVAFNGSDASTTAPLIAYRPVSVP